MNNTIALRPPRLHAPGAQKRCGVSGALCRAGPSVLWGALVGTPFGLPCGHIGWNNLMNTPKLMRLRATKIDNG